MVANRSKNNDDHDVIFITMGMTVVKTADNGRVAGVT